MVVRIYCGGIRKRYEVPDESRADLLRAIARRLANAGLEGKAETVLRAAASASDIREVMAAVELLCSRETEPSDTFRAIGEAWTSGDLNRRYPDHVRLKRSAENDRLRLGVLYPTIGTVPVTRFTINDADRAMASLPDTARASATRRQYAQVIAKVLRYAVFPLRLIQSSPLPTGWLPIVRSPKMAAWLYPDEDLQLLSCENIPVQARLLYGFLAREGCRLGEALSLTWADFDLKRGIVRLDKNKTDDPRAWALSSGCSEVLKEYRGANDVNVFPSNDPKPAETFRRHLRVAGIARPELFESSGGRRPIRVHDLRATFITISLAAGRSETWVADRTGHKSSTMINRYRRAARSAAELGLGDLSRFDVAIGQTIGHGPRQAKLTDSELPY